jgi:glycosyltransferase involved in cell wall biosynthesis
MRELALLCDIEVVPVIQHSGYKVCYECHDWFKKNKPISLFFLRNVDKIIATNSYIKDEFVRNGFKEWILAIAPNSVDLSVFDSNLDKEQAIKKLDIVDSLKQEIFEKKVILYTGSFKTMGVEKGIADILRAIKEIKMENVLFIAVGGSEDDVVFYKKMAEELGVQNKARFVGRVDQSTISLFQKVSDILLMPFPRIAHYEYHMTPLKMFEYMASKRPIIASSLPSIKEVLNESNCLFCIPDNVVDLIRKIEYLLEDDVLSKKLADQAYLDVKKYTWQNRAREIISIINPLVSVVLPVHSDKYVGAAIDSIINQSYKNIEIIILSTNTIDQESLSIINSFQDSRIRHITGMPYGNISASLNRGIREANGIYIARMDSDDISLPNRIEEQVKYMKSHPDISISGTFAKSFGSFSVLMSQPVLFDDVKANILFHTSMIHPTVIFRRDDILKNNLWYDESLRKSEDSDMWWRCSLCVRLANIPKVLLFYRRHQKQVSGNIDDLYFATKKSLRTKQFTRLNIEMTDREFYIHKLVCSFDAEASTDFLLDVANWLEKISKANKSVGLYNQMSLENLLGEKWFIVCLVSIMKGNKSAWDIFWKNDLSKRFVKTPRNIARLIKFFARYLV